MKRQQLSQQPAVLTSRQIATCRLPLSHPSRSDSPRLFVLSSPHLLQKNIKEDDRSFLSNMFNRDNLFGSRQPQQPQQPPQNFSQPTQRTQPVPSPQYQDQRRQQVPPPDQEMRGYSNGMNQRQQAPPPARSHRSSMGSRIQLRPAKSPDNTYTFGNLCAVNSSDVPPSHDGQDVYLLVNGGYVISARPIASFERGRISLSDAQRTWLQIALTDVVEVQPFDPFSSGPQSYLGSIDVEVGFAGKKSTDVPYVSPPTC